MKYNIGFGRKVQTRPYENLEFNLSVEFEDDEAPLEYMKENLVKKVEEWIDSEFQKQGITKTKKEIILKH